MKGLIDSVRSLGRSCSYWKQRLTQKYWPWMKESSKESQSCFLHRERRSTNVLGDNFGHVVKEARASLRGGDLIFEALETDLFTFWNVLKHMLRALIK